MIRENFVLIDEFVKCMKTMRSAMHNAMEMCSNSSNKITFAC